MHCRDYFARARVGALIRTLALLAAAVAGALAFPLASRAATEAVKEGAAAPDFVLKTTDGRNLRLSEYRGDVVVLAFWASWCGSCSAALSELNSMTAAQGEDRPVVLGVSLDGDAGRASSIAQSLGLKFPTMVDSHQAVGRLYDVKTLPLTLLVDRDGIVRGTWAAAPASTAELTHALQEIGQ
jgi:peroxiredoxin